MAAEYFLYDTNFNGTLIDRGKTSFNPTPPYEEIYIDYFIPTSQPLYLYANSGGTGGTIVPNTQEIIDTYLNSLSVPSDSVEGRLRNIENENTGKIDKVTGATNNIAIFTSDGNVKNGNVSIDLITGGSAYYFYTENRNSIVNNSKTDIDYINVTSDILMAGTWSIDFMAIGGQNNTKKDIIVGFYIDDVLEGIEYYIRSDLPKNRYPFVLTLDRILSGGSHTFGIKFRVSKKGVAVLDFGSIRAKFIN